MKGKGSNVIIFVGLGVVFVAILVFLFLKILNGKHKFSDEEISVENPSYQIDVLNGCGVEDVAFQITQYLRSKGFDVIDYGNYDLIVNESFIIDHVGWPDTAKVIAKALGIDEGKIVRSKSNYYNEFTVVIGKDYIMLKPFKNKDGESF
ncbi:LytR cell envelope-related transcriptional attenuator [Candidatus Kryptonium thompsonii]|uniref:LytR cell envelope-related transcriptional attenuator n=1 Tax=Candidatus Kryptonium thompsonii TaxID=1633631 RepID=A0A0P1LJK4_9BACT|nr:LytR C-terminal domain-containing protein [Candidatus Kryptonium thompsoni]CUS76382.1 LytR cell envelope-related transcriptional attenuator [Candidatus Kryptonium thompsoni]CUS76481.1 LytR cell envelope-related transcriptional attenuator [Candidatus Kryptonium thompsoni]CUS79590.1 LytR cell envelope-related transcriptional attenuator [Candidatus Kryptonium thompsoni]CUS81540.1 LytR cell envelope-related transcriptional attenuator [Candidatus Kryptonium thompsoni]CUS85011.1 LytR cell envelop